MFNKISKTACQQAKFYSSSIQLLIQEDVNLFYLRKSKFLRKKLGSGANSGKMLVRVVENNIIDVYVGQVRLSKGKLCPAGLVKGLGQGPAGLEPLAVARKNIPSPEWVEFQ